jgi:formylglycine-generating enzyme required for sulfatase activity
VEFRASGHGEFQITTDALLDHVPTGRLVDRMAGMNVRAAKGMREIPSGEFLMGSDDFYPEERPVHSEQVAGFWIDEHPVTNAEFRRFINETGYRTTAEAAPDPGEFPDADPADLVPGSLVFRPSAGPVPLDDWRRWWQWTPGASWRTPEGPGSNLGGRERHPVVHVSYEDALAYASWSGKHLPTEIEWEYAARAGRPPTTYAWGDDLAPHGKIMANFWHGHFPWQNDRPPGKDRTSPVGTYPCQSLGPDRHDRERLGMDHHSVDRRSHQPPCAARFLLRAASIARAGRSRPTSHEGRLTSLRPQLLRPLPPRRPTRPNRPQQHQPHRLPLHTALIAKYCAD